MIQRIQSLYLLIATALMAVTLFTPIAAFTAGGEELVLKAFAFSDRVDGAPIPTLWMGILLSLSTLLPLVTIFLYRHRRLQIRLCGVEIVFLLGDIVFEVLYIVSAYRAMAGMDGAAAVSFAAVMPLAAIILVVMAMRAIFKDELLIRSLDRIR